MFISALATWRNLRTVPESSLLVAKNTELIPVDGRLRNSFRNVNVYIKSTRSGIW